jgi:hypothetical protein
VASAPPVHHHAADASANADDTEKGELSERRRQARQQHEEGWQYALALVREAYVPEKQEGIVNRNSYLDHALVIASRDANEKNRGGELGGWGVCQVLATVELKLIDSTCKEFARESDSDASIVIKRSNLTKTGGAGPLAQEVMYVFGHVLWSHAALGLQLPTSLPLAVVAAMKEKAATALPSTRMRWVYGNLDIPEECGGMFSFNVSSCGAFHDTAPESAIAVYMKVLMYGLDQGERWINDMLHPRRHRMRQGHRRRSRRRHNCRNRTRGPGQALCAAVGYSLGGPYCRCLTQNWSQHRRVCASWISRYRKASCTWGG